MLSVSTPRQDSQSGTAKSPRSPMKGQAVSSTPRPDDVCDNPKCKEMRRVERTMVNNLKQEVATLKMQIAQLTQQLQVKEAESEEREQVDSNVDGELQALRNALSEEAHSHGVAIAEASAQIAALKLKLTVKEKEVQNLREKRASERGKYLRSDAQTKALQRSLREMEEELAEAYDGVASGGGLSGVPPPPVPKGIPQSSARRPSVIAVSKAKEQAEEVASKLQDRLQSVEARAAGLRALSLRQAQALSVASLSEKQASAQVEKAKDAMAELKARHKVEIEKKRKAAVVFSTLCAQQVVRAKQAADALRQQVGELEGEKREWKQVEAALNAQHAEAELRNQKADTALAELNAKHDMLKEQNATLSKTVALVSHKHETASAKLAEARETAADTETALQSAMSELHQMASEVTALEGHVSSQLATMGRAIEGRDATSKFVQEVLRLALRRLETLEASFGELVSGELPSDGTLHGALLRVLRDVARIDLGVQAKSSTRTVHGSALFDHFPQHVWRVHQLSHVLCVSMREAPPELQERMSAAEAHKRSGGRAAKQEHAKMHPAPSTAMLLAQLEGKGALAGPQPPIAGAAIRGVGAARPLARGLTPEARARSRRAPPAPGGLAGSRSSQMLSRGDPSAEPLPPLAGSSVLDSRSGVGGRTVSGVANGSAPRGGASWASSGEWSDRPPRAGSRVAAAAAAAAEAAEAAGAEGVASAGRPGTGSGGGGGAAAEQRGPPPAVRQRTAPSATSAGRGAPPPGAGGSALQTVLVPTAIVTEEGAGNPPRSTSAPATGPHDGARNGGGGAGTADRTASSPAQGAAARAASSRTAFRLAGTEPIFSPQAGARSPGGSNASRSPRALVPP